ncbi:basic proline-rich protein-like [Muntiacus reevesi]|uniref:basic proline-rich protein-like n=1 Tax=Muntiacus reevesi TaxID=9886 RepID=UPI003307C230
MQHQLQRRPAGFHREVPQEKAPPRRRPGSARSKTQRGGPMAATGSAWALFTFVSGTPAPSRARDPARGPELVTHPSLAKSGRAFPLTSSRGLYGLTGPGAPKVGGTRPSPALPSVGAPGQAVFTPPGLTRPGTKLGMRRRPYRLEPRLPRPGQPRWPLRPVRSPPPGPGPARPGLRAPPPGLATTRGPDPGRESAGPRGGRPHAYLSARGSSSCSCLGSRTALAARPPGGAEYKTASAAREELRPERAPPSRQSTPTYPSAPPSAVGSAPRPACQAPPLPVGPAHPAGRRVTGGGQGR